MTQPGIKYLEAKYGVKLFEYDGRNLTKTSNAELLKWYAYSTIVQVNVIKNLHKKP